MRNFKWFSRPVLLALALAAISASPALAHEAPKGSEWVMANWMFLSFMIFAGAAFVAFLAALKAGWLSNLEEAKHYVLQIEEGDYYTSDWAQPGGEV